VDFSLFYFADDGDREGDGYRLLMEGAAIADANGFTAVWTPERHFHRFGGLFPNPAVTAAAVAAVTSHVEVRAGSVVLPLHHPLRLAEEWAVVDKLSGGRTGLSLASGWNRSDFVLRPEAYENRRQETIDGIDLLRRLWRGEPFIDRSGAEYRPFPQPLRAEPRLWLTSAGSVQTFEAAGQAGVGILTHLLSHPVAELAGKITRYRHAYAASGHPGRGHVVLMVHTYLDEDLGAAERVAGDPLRRYLMSSLDLGVAPANQASGGDGSCPGTLTPARARLAVAGAADRYLHRDGLFGSVRDVLPVVRAVAAADVDEIACLVDFGVPVEAALRGVARIAELQEATR
jgi:natural product biosynthesis luciferase-like monooxygenase protein